MRRFPGRLFMLIVACSLLAIPIPPGTTVSATEGNSLTNVAEASQATLPIPATPEEKSLRFPVLQAHVNSRIMGGGVRGFGMLAQYESPGPREVYVRRVTSPGQNGTLHFNPITYVKVIDPDGNTAAYYQLTDQSAAEQEVVLSVPDGKPGIWRVSYYGGRLDDRLEIGLPQTDIWGIRGEQNLGITETTPTTAYLYLPRTVRKSILIGYHPSDNANLPGFSLYASNGQLLGNTQWVSSKKRSELVLNNIQSHVGTVWKFTHSGVSGQSIAFDGVPGLLAPTREAALALMGGTVESADGLLAQGPVQAKAREVMYGMKDADFQVNLNWDGLEVTDSVYPQLDSQLYGAYGVLSNLKFGLSLQNLDAESPYFGAFPDPPNNLDSFQTRLSWESFLYGGRLSIHEPSTLSTAASTDLPLNPAYNNQALINRAVIGSLFHIAQMQGDDQLRELTLETTDYPISHSFFIYPLSIALPYMQLKDKVDPVTREVWRQGLIAVGDKIADYTAYQSNQWSHVILGHLYTYLATGEERFLGYFERMMDSYLDYYPDRGKLGQHPDGYFLEEYGPDGNYEELSLINVVDAYYRYRSLAGAKPELAEKIKAAVEKSLTFQSFYYLPLPEGTPYFPNDGTFISPSAMNSRSQHHMMNEGYPGEFIAYPEFPLAAARYALSKDPGGGIGKANIMPYIANNEGWIQRLLTWGLNTKDDGFPASGRRLSGYAVDQVLNAYRLPKTAAPVMLPAQQEQGTWQQQGQLAWKRGSLYGVILYGVDPSSLQSKSGGAPIALWSKGTGLALSSMRSSKVANIQSPADITFSSVYGEDVNGKFFYTGNDISNFQWIEQDRSFEIKSTMAKVPGELKWQYELLDGEIKVKVSLHTTQPVRNAYVNLPFSLYLKNPANTAVPLAQIEQPENGRFVYRIGNSVMEATWPSDVPATTAEAATNGYGDVMNLRIPLPAGGQPLEFSIKAYDLDVTAPVTEATLEPAVPDGQNGWYVNPVTLNLAAADDLSGLERIEYNLDHGGTWQPYTSPLLFDQDGEHTVSFRSTDRTGHAEPAKSIGFRIDAAAPTIVVSGLEEGGSYANSGDLTPLVAVSDGLSGVDSGKTSVTLNTYGVQPGTTIPLYTLQKGLHTLVATSSDLAGNQASVTVTFRTVTSIDTLMELVERFAESNWISNGGIANSLQVKLRQNNLTSFMNQVRAQSGKHITAEAAQYLLRDAQSMIAE